MALTRRQKQLYDFVSEFVESNGYSPSYQEIGDGLGLSSLATVHKHISNLEDKGLLKKGANRSRSIDLLKPKGRMKQAFSPPLAVPFGFSLPFAGRIVAGRPLETSSSILPGEAERISLADFTNSKEVFVLQVTGDSMQDEHIVDGDYVLVEKTRVARDGEIVVALVGGEESTLKRIYVEGDKVRLQPSNVNMAPIIAPAESVQVQGRVIGVLRKY